MYKKVVLVSSANLTIERPPPGLAFLAGVCEASSIDYDIFDLNMFLLDHFGKEKWDALTIMSTGSQIVCDADFQLEIDHALECAVKQILKNSPDLIALTSFSSMQISWTTRLLQHIRMQSDVTIIAGGPGISYEQEPTRTAGKILAEQNLLDYYVLGEGDLVFGNFLKGQVDLGVNAKGSKFENWVPQLDQLDNLPLPSYKKMDLSKYQSTLKNRAAAITITGSRGCVRRCTFCDVGHLWKKFRFRSSKSIVNEMLKHYNEVNCLNYVFSDSLINGSLKQFIEIMQQIVELHDTYPDLKNLSYSGQFIIRPQKHHPEYMYELMSQSGCDHLEIGIESGSERVREHMGKKFSNEDIDYHFEMCEKYKIKNYILMFPAYPTETIEDHKETIDFYIRNQKYLINNTIIGTNLNTPMMILKNTPIDQMKHELGIQTHSSHYENISDWDISSNPDLTVKERWRRYIELVELTTALKYPRAAFDPLLLEVNISQIEKIVEEL